MRWTVRAAEDAGKKGAPASPSEAGRLGYMIEGSETESKVTCRLDVADASAASDRALAPADYSSMEKKGVVPRRATQTTVEMG